MPTEQELAGRRPVWVALADLFLDTDVRISYPYIARTLVESSYFMEELRRILDDEVTPVLQSNLLNVAGEWAGFDQEWLVREMSKRLNKRRWAPLLVNMDRQWNVVAQLAEVLRRLPPEARLRRTQVWSSLLPLICNRHGRMESGVSELTVTELEPIFRELWHVLRQEARRLAELDPEVYPSEDEIESNWRNVSGPIC